LCIPLERDPSVGIERLRRLDQAEVARRHEVVAVDVRGDAGAETGHGRAHEAEVMGDQGVRTAARRFEGHGVGIGLGSGAVAPRPGGLPVAAPPAGVTTAASAAVV